MIPLFAKGQPFSGNDPRATHSEVTRPDCRPVADCRGFLRQVTQGVPEQSGICTFSSWSLLFPAQSHPFLGQPGTFSLLLHLLDNKGLRSHHYPLAFVGDLSVKVDSSGSSGSLGGHLSTAMFPAAVLTQDLIRDPHCF